MSSCCSSSSTPENKAAGNSSSTAPSASDCSAQDIGKQEKSAQQAPAKKSCCQSTSGKFSLADSISAQSSVEAPVASATSAPIRSFSQSPATPETTFSPISPSSCCGSPPPSKVLSSCCGGESKKRFDWLLWGSLIVVALGYSAHFFFADQLSHQAAHFSQGVFELMNKMWWGLALGILAVGAMGWMPREWVASVLGKPGSFSGIIRAMSAGLLLDLCNHGILLVAMKLYERGASLGQTLAFIIASPWNSLSLTIILISLIGLPWTVAFVFLSALIAVITGLAVERLVKSGRLPANPNQVELPEGFHLGSEVRQTFKKARINHTLLAKMIQSGISGSSMILRWVFFGTVLAAAIRAFVPMDIFGDWFGPTWIGVLLTLVAATVIEVCSEGSSPIAADLVTRAQAPGNGFAFLMAGAATDYTEIMALKETTGLWKTTFILPLLTLPQVVVVAWLLNSFSS